MDSIPIASLALVTHGRSGKTGMDMRAHRVLVVDDNQAIRRGICQLLRTQSELEIVSEAANGAEAVKAKQYHPDLVLLDVSMPVMNGFEAARIIKHELPLTQILMVSNYESPVFGAEATAAGASGYVSKTSVTRDLIDAVRALDEEGAGPEGKRA